MSEKKQHLTAKQIVLRYRHAGWFLLYCVFYLAGFSVIEKASHVHFHIIHTWLDEQIPFCRFFIIPYYLWFGYIGVGVTWFVLCCRDRDEYYRLIAMLMTGMTIFIVVSAVYPNRLMLRPDSIPQKDIFAVLCRALYASDTPTNVLPSIHVFNSMAMCYAINENKQLQKKKFVLVSSNILTALIVLATMFLKQHSVIDVSLGIVMSVVLQVIFDQVFETGEAAVRVSSRQQERSMSRKAY